jgi:hypothetical protein
MPRRDWLLISLAIEPVEARTRLSAVRPAANFEHARALVGDGGISASSHVLPFGLRHTDIYLGIKTCL